MSSNRTHLDHLENQSIFIFREAYHAFKNIAMPWSMGKDSNVLVWLALKSFFGKIPFPVLHIDTTYEFPEMLEFREWATAALQAQPDREDQHRGPRARGRLRNARPGHGDARVENGRSATSARRIQMGRIDHRNPPR